RVCSRSARRPATIRIGSPCTFQVTEPGPNNPRSLMCSTLAPATRADAPVRDLGLVDDEAGRVDRVETRGGAGGAVDVGDLAAEPAHQVVMVVADPGLVPGRAAGRG